MPDGCTLHEGRGYPQFDAARGAEDQDLRPPHEDGHMARSLHEKGIPGILQSSEDDDTRTIVSWEENDPGNPYNWSRLKRGLTVCLAMMLIVNGTMGSALPSNAIPFIAEQFDVRSPQQLVLPISIYMVGFLAGPIIWGPLSEQYGRRIIVLGTFFCFAIWTMACALAPNFAALIVFRLFAGIFGSAPIAIVPGIVADLYGNYKSRGRAMAVFMATTCFGPLFAPVISGFVSPSIGWRWSFWIGLIYAGLTGALLIFLPETFGPVLLVRRAHALRKADPIANARCAAVREVEVSPSLKQLATVVVARPLRMILFELIVSCTCAYLALVYAIFYMTFEAFPIIFHDLYGLSPGATGLAFLSFGGGSLLSLLILLAYDPALIWARRKWPVSTRGWPAVLHSEDFRRLPLACIGGPLYASSLFWLGFSSRLDVPVIVPILAGFPFGTGFMLIFVALLNYLTDSYEIFAASANAAAAMARSFFAVVLPLATTVMFKRLGISGACSLLGSLSAVMCLIPFVFIWKGRRIREGSKFCAALRDQKMEAERPVESRERHRGPEGVSGAGRVQGGQ